jgi:cytochrome c oxidase subunit 2
MSYVRIPLVLASAAALADAGCTGSDRQSALDPAGVQAERIHGIWYLYLWVTAAVYLAVMAVLVAAVVRRSRAGSDRPITAPPLHKELRKGLVVTAATVVTALILFVFLVGDFLTGRRIDSLARDNALTVRITGHQWWWEVRYDDAVPSNVVTTANEIHLPRGRAIRFELEAADVIHSFWVPNLHGKTDMIPGHTSVTFLRADRTGEFWGQCAEFCGHQHANMRLQVVVHEPADYEKWLSHQRKPAADPVSESRKKGQQVFLTNTCVMCHTITGTPAGSRVGPDLTHLASRSRIAAGTLQNTRGNLERWVLDAHTNKPGVRMPPNPLSPEQLVVLLDYLESLQ